MTSQVSADASAAAMRHAAAMQHAAAAAAAQLVEAVASERNRIETARSEGEAELRTRQAEARAATALEVSSACAAVEARARADAEVLAQQHVAAMAALEASVVWARTEDQRRTREQLEPLQVRSPPISPYDLP